MNWISYRPTRKWFASLTGGVASILALWITSGNFDDPEKALAGGLIVSLAAAYFQTNQATATGDGVPVKEVV